MRSYHISDPSLSIAKTGLVILYNANVSFYWLEVWMKPEQKGEDTARKQGIFYTVMLQIINDLRPFQKTILQITICIIRLTIIWRKVARSSWTRFFTLYLHIVYFGNYQNIYTPPNKTIQNLLKM